MSRGTGGGGAFRTPRGEGGGGGVVGVVVVVGGSRYRSLSHRVRGQLQQRGRQSGRQAFEADRRALGSADVHVVALPLLAAGGAEVGIHQLHDLSQLRGEEREEGQPAGSAASLWRRRRRRRVEPRDARQHPRTLDRLKAKDDAIWHLQGNISCVGRIFHHFFFFFFDSCYGNKTAC